MISLDSATDPSILGIHHKPDNITREKALVAGRNSLYSVEILGAVDATSPELPTIRDPVDENRWVGTKLLIWSSLAAVRCREENHSSATAIKGD
jgi:hypothetical protein